MRGLRLAEPRDRGFVCRSRKGGFIDRYLSYPRWFRQRLMRPGFYTCDLDGKPVGAAWVEDGYVFYVATDKYPEADIKNWMLERVQYMYGNALRERNAG